MSNKAVIWPVYLNRKKTRSEGRRVPKRIAVDSPHVEEVSEALRRLNHTCEIIKGKAPPNSWWEKTGYVIVEKKGRPKQDLLHRTARELTLIRREKPKGK